MKESQDMPSVPLWDHGTSSPFQSDIQTQSLVPRIDRKFEIDPFNKSRSYLFVYKHFFRYLSLKSTFWNICCLPVFLFFSCLLSSHTAKCWLKLNGLLSNLYLILAMAGLLDLIYSIWQPIVMIFGSSQNKALFLLLPKYLMLILIFIYKQRRLWRGIQWNNNFHLLPTAKPPSNDLFGQTLSLDWLSIVTILKFLKRWDCGWLHSYQIHINPCCLTCGVTLNPCCCKLSLLLYVSAEQMLHLTVIRTS